jgi:hypothetical protein
MLHKRKPLILNSHEQQDADANTHTHTNIYIYGMGCSVTEVSSSQGIQQSRCFPFLNLRTETNTVSETLCFIVPRTSNNVLSSKPSDCEHYKPSSEPFKISLDVFLDMTVVR